MKKKNFSLIYISIFLLLVIIICVFVFVSSYKGLRKDINNSNYKTLYASVLETGKNYIKVKDANSDDIYYLKTHDKDISVGEIVSISYKDSIDNYKDIEVIIDESEEIFIEDTTKTTTTTSKTTKEIMKTTSTVSTTKTKKIKTTSSKVQSTLATSDNNIIESVRESYSLVESANETTISENIKNKFIEIVDFIFYGKEIKGRTFESLSMEAKGKVIYYALLIDAKIESKWPQYKETISEKYNDIKAKLLAKYLDITTKACESDKHACEIFKKDFSLLKGSLKLTWNVIKSAFSYAYDKTSSAITDWYEVFSGKV